MFFGFRAYRIHSYLVLFVCFFISIKLEASQSQLDQLCADRASIESSHKLEVDGPPPGVFRPFFSHLPLDQYLAAKGKSFRRRRFSLFRFEEGRMVSLPPKSFVQAKDINPLFANVPRSFEPIEPKLILEADFAKLLSMFVERLPGNSSQYEIGVHQIRVLADPVNKIDIAQPVPEGRHKDGVDFIGIYVVDRNNVSGALTILSLSQDGEPVYQNELHPGQLLILNDRIFWHEATPIQSTNGELATRDVFIITAEKTTNP